MGILQRFTDIMSANINALLDKAEDPEKMIDQYLRNLESDLGKVKAETAAVMAEEKRAKRELDGCMEEISKMQTYAQKALVSGNEADARQFLVKKAELTAKGENLQKAYDLAAANAAKMREMHDKLVGDINDLNARKDAIKAKVAVAKTQERLNKLGSSIAGAQNSVSAFDKMEAKVDKMLDEANAMAELNAKPADEISELAKKYDSDSSSTVDDELAAMKAELGL
jgi:phage shock protein A